MSLLNGFKTNMQLPSQLIQAFILSPESGFRCQQSSRQQMRINITNTFTHPLLLLNNVQHFLMAGNRDRGQLLPQAQQVGAITQITASQLTNNHRVHSNAVSYQQLCQQLIACTQMVNPDRSIHQYHNQSLSEYRRETSSTCGSLPPNNANRRALSRSIKAFKPSRTMALFSPIPIRLAACVYKSSSIVTVVRMAHLPKASNCSPFYTYFNVLAIKKAWVVTQALSCLNGSELYRAICPNLIFLSCLCGRWRIVPIYTKTVN